MNEIITAEATEISLAPNARAIQITERIKANARTAVNAVCAIGKDLRTMKVDGLYTELGYGSFEEYSEKEFELKRRQAYQYIEVYDKLGEAFVQSNAQLGITKLALLATANPEDRAEVMENEDVNDMTAKELKELLGKYKEQGEQLSLLQEEKDAAEKAYSEESDRVQELVNDQIDKNRKIFELEQKVAELENKPIEVATKEIQVPDPVTKQKLAKAEEDLKQATKELKEVKSERELFRKSAENAKKVASEKAEESIKKIQEQAEREKAALKAQIAELREAAAKPPENADKSNFKVMLSTVYKDMLGLAEFIKEAESGKEKELYLKKSLEILNACKDTIMRIEIQPHIEVTDSNDYDYGEGDDE